jgi:hypothetical protein
MRTYWWSLGYISRAQLRIRSRERDGEWIRNDDVHIWFRVERGGRREQVSTKLMVSCSWWRDPGRVADQVAGVERGVWRGASAGSWCQGRRRAGGRELEMRSGTGAWLVYLRLLFVRRRQGMDEPTGAFWSGRKCLRCLLFLEERERERLDCCISLISWFQRDIRDKMRLIAILNSLLAREISLCFGTDYYFYSSTTFCRCHYC